MEENDRKNPMYLTNDRMMPGRNDLDNMVITFAAYKEKKTDMSYEEHIAFCREVVRAHETGEFDERVLDVDYWFRMRRR